MKHNKRYGSPRRPKIFYIDSNMLINTCYTVINKTSAICISTISCYIDDCVTINTTFKDFPNNLGFYPSVQLLNTVNEPDYNVFIYKLDVDFDNTINTMDIESDINEVYPDIDDDIIKLINHHLFKVRNEETFYSDMDYDEEEDFEEDDYE